MFNFTELVAAKKAAPLLRDVWMEGNQVMAARSQSGSEKGLYVAAKGGHNDESHNHNDVGNFIVYVNGLPMIIDVGVETHTRKTFSAQRYNITVQIFVFLAKNFNSQKTIWTQRSLRFSFSL